MYSGDTIGVPCIIDRSREALKIHNEQSKRLHGKGSQASREFYDFITIFVLFLERLLRKEIRLSYERKEKKI